MNLTLVKSDEWAGGYFPANMPYVNGDGDLIIPFCSPSCYHYWKPSIKEGEYGVRYMTLNEVIAEVAR